MSGRAADNVMKELLAYLLIRTKSCYFANCGELRNRLQQA
jgi:hypothetical protein